MFCPICLQFCKQRFTNTFASEPISWYYEGSKGSMTCFNWSSIFCLCSFYQRQYRNYTVLDMKLGVSVHDANIKQYMPQPVVAKLPYSKMQQGQVSCLYHLHLIQWVPSPNLWILWLHCYVMHLSPHCDNKSTFFCSPGHLEQWTHPSQLVFSR